ncbi:unnamed protein product [Allacma fusca]|uniref:Carbonic anhydrase n=1 Tax=Allacma fusca TaxID=39272 RepID=A0A8J2K5L1_9HEXA|nr:unnamed protein product [Allacma fusca]
MKHQNVLTFSLAFVTFICLPARIQAGHGKDFCYTLESCDPDHWEGLCKDGKNQSPIDLSVPAATIKKPKHPLSFGRNFRSTQRNFLITNNGHSVQMQLSESGTSKNEFIHEDKNLHYKFSQLHFHWGVGNTNGSEHTLNNQRFPLELHLVHYKKKYSSLAAAVNSHDPTALSVIGVFYKIGAHNEALQHIVKEVHDKVLKEKSGGKLLKTTETVSLWDFLPKKQSLFRYQGSLTTPTCDEIVLWLVFDTPVELSKDQIQVFHEIQATLEKGNKFHNFRPLQSLEAVIFREVASGHGDITEINYPSSKATENLGLFEANTPGLIPGKITNGKNIKDSKQDLESVSQGIRALCYMSTNCKPEFWTGTCQNGKSQSPINLDVRNSFNKSGYPLEFEEGYVTNKRSFFIANDGHSTLIQLQKGGTSNCSFTHSDLRLRYTFSQLHFHWGKFGDYGSEHTVQTQRFPIEMHLVHYKSSYESLDDALDSKDSTAVSVIAVFFKIASANKALEPILSRMKEASAKRSPEVTKQLALKPFCGRYLIIPLKFQISRRRRSGVLYLATGNKQKQAVTGLFKI